MKRCRGVMKIHFDAVRAVAGKKSNMTRTRKTQNTKKNNGANLGFEEKLWQAAVNSIY